MHAQPLCAPPQLLHRQRPATLSVTVCVAARARACVGDDAAAWLTEIAVLHYRLRDAGYDVTCASLTGGSIPLPTAEVGAMPHASLCCALLRAALRAGAMIGRCTALRVPGAFVDARCLAASMRSAVL